MPDRRGPARRESLSSAERLRRRVDYQNCYRRGRRKHGQLSILYSVPNGLEHPRLGITASRKVGGAVARIRIKRRIREIYRRWSRRSELPAVDLMVHVKPPASRAGFQELERELRGHFRQVLRSGRARPAARSAPSSGSTSE